MSSQRATVVDPTGIDAAERAELESQEYTVRSLKRASDRRPGWLSFEEYRDFVLKGDQSEQP